MHERVQNKMISDPPFLVLLQMFKKKASFRTRIPKIARTEFGPRRPLRAKEFESGSAKLPKLSFAWKTQLRIYIHDLLLESDDVLAGSA